MCGRFASTSSVSDIVGALAVEEVRAEALPERYNVAPTNQVYAVAVSHSRRVLGTFRWGLVPSWAKDVSVGYKMINARAEGIGDRPAYRRALAKRRCIIPVDSYYEWQARPAEAAPDPGPVAGGATGRGRKPKAPPKLPWAIHRADGALMAMAGLWEAWRDPAAGPDAQALRSCTIVTTAANPALAVIHDRMPAILDAAGVDAWLDPTVIDRDLLGSLLVPAPSEWFHAYPVSTLVNKVGVDGPELLEPLPPPPSAAGVGLPPRG